MPAHDPIIMVFVWLNLVDKDKGSCKLLMACDKTEYIEMGKSKFHYAFADSTGPYQLVCTFKIAKTFNKTFHLLPYKDTTNFYRGSLFD